MKDIKESIKTATTTVPAQVRVNPGLLNQPQVSGELSPDRPGHTIRVGLFMGGASSEKEISLESARHVYNSLDREKYEVLPIFVDEKRHLHLIEEGLLWKNTTADITSSLEGFSRTVCYEDLKVLIDFAFIA